MASICSRIKGLLSREKIQNLRGMEMAKKKSGRPRAESAGFSELYDWLLI
jgi:hypothetical protein